MRSGRQAIESSVIAARLSRAMTGDNGAHVDRFNGSAKPADRARRNRKNWPTITP
jgi:hypothetical protein